MKLFAKTIMMMLLVASFAVEKANAQNFWGTGMAMGMGSCGYQVDIGDEATSIGDDIKELEENVKDLKKKKSEFAEKVRDFERKRKKGSEAVKDKGLNGDAYSLVSDHIIQQNDCSVYLQPGVVETRPSAYVSDTSRTPSTGTSPGSGKPTSPYDPAVWRQMCSGVGSLKSDVVCRESVGQIKPSSKYSNKSFDLEACTNGLQDWQEAQKEIVALKKEIKEIDEAIAELSGRKGKIASKKKERDEAIKQYMNDKRQEMTEGGCVDCYIAGNSGGVYAPRKSSGLEVAANVALGLGAMYFGNRLNQYVSDNNAKLGFATQSYPSFGYGYPYFMGALYGAIGGGVGGGAFGCGGGVGGGGFPMGPYGMMGPYAMGGLYGPGGMGGAFGYPQGMYGPSMGGGMYLPGMGPGGMAGPWGLGGMGNPYGMGGMGGLGGMMGMGNPYGMGGMGGMGMCIQAPCPVGGMGAGGFPFGMGGMGGMNPFGMGGMMGMGNPYGMGGMGGMNPYGMGMGGMAGLGMGYPGMMGMGGMNPYGMGGMGGMNPYGMGMGGMMNPYGMGGMGGMNPYGMGGMMNPYGMGGMGGMNPFGMGGMMNPYGMGGPGMMGMGGMDPFGMGGMNGMGGMMGAQAQMQMQMQQMQMQMQQYQQMMDMQRRRYDQYVQQQRVVGQLTQEISSLYMRLQQAQMGMYSGGYLGFEGNANYNVQGGVNYNTLPYQTNQYQYQTNPYQPGYNPGYQQPGGRLNVR